MSQQVNLYDPALRRQFDPLTLSNVVAVGVFLAVVVGVAGYTAKSKSDRLQGELTALAAQNKLLQEQTVVLGAKVANLKPDPMLQAELVKMRNQLAQRGEVIGVLQKSLGPQAVSFAEYLRALARQTPGNLWLTGFVASGDGGHMEIRGRMTDGSALPDYIRRLSGEKAFQGRAFAALQMQAETLPPAQGGDAGRPAQPAGPRHLEFSLVPKAAEAGASAGVGAKPPVEQMRELAGVRQ